MTQDFPKMVPTWPKMGQDVPKMAQDNAKMAPQNHQFARTQPPREFKILPTCSKTAQYNPKQFHKLWRGPWVASLCGGVRQEIKHQAASRQASSSKHQAANIKKLGPRLWQKIKNSWLYRLPISLERSSNGTDNTSTIQRERGRHQHIDIILSLFGICS